MKPDRDKEFEQNMTQLVDLLKKMVKNLPTQGNPLKQFQSKDTAINMNICIFSFLPITPEDLEEWEDLYDQFVSGQDPASSGEDLSMDLSSSDFDFLKKYGIKF